MADQEVQKPAHEKAAAATPTAAGEEEVLVVTDVEKEAVVPQPVPVPESETPEVVKPENETAAVEETQVVKSGGDEEAADNNKMEHPQPACFKEETTKISDLPENEKKALLELKQLVQEALNKHELSPTQAEAKHEDKKKEEKAPEIEEAKKVVDDETKPKEEPETKTEEKETQEKEGVEEKTATTTTASVPEATADDDGAKTVEAIEETIVAVSSASQTEQQQQEEVNKVEEETKTETQKQPEEVSIWGIPLLADERSDVILLKFLRARDFKVKDALAMLKNTIQWRKEFGIEELVDQDLGLDDLEKVVFMHGFDREGHPVCYNVYGEFQNKELYQKTFSDEEKRQRFLKWRIQFLERSIRKLDFTPGGISTIVQINDLKNSPGPGKWELRQATKQALHLLQDNYPEFVAKQVFINVPWWYLAVNRMISPFLTQRTRSKFVFAGPSKSAETLFRYIAAEQVPVKYGGLSKDGEFEPTDAVTEITVRPAAKHTVEFPVTEKCSLSWEVRVVGWDVSYGAEFVPSAEDSYTVIIQKARRVGSDEEPVVSNSFKAGEPGKVVLTIDNTTNKKKKLLYRLKSVLSLD